jgi:hypothetical protein
MNPAKSAAGRPFRAAVIPRYFFSVMARKSTMRFHALAASAASAERYPSFVVGILEGVAGLIVDLDVDPFPTELRGKSKSPRIKRQTL